MKFCKVNLIILLIHLTNLKKQCKVYQHYKFTDLIFFLKIFFTQEKKEVVSLEKNVKVSLLCQIYGKMLTKKQYEVINDYYNNDLSLSEIAENNNITRQAVRDIIKKGENKLFYLEEKLAFMEKTLKQEKQLQQILDELSKIETTSSDKKIEKILNHVREELSCLAQNFKDNHHLMSFAKTIILFKIQFKFYIMEGAK